MRYSRIFISFIAYFAILGSAWSVPPNVNVTYHHLYPSTICTLGSGKMPCESTVNLAIEGVGDPYPIQVVFAIDYSASMNTSDPDKERLKAAKNAVTNMSFSRDKVGLVCWNHTIIRYINLTNDFDYIIYILDAIEPKGGTNFDKALNESIGIFNNSSDDIPKCIIFLSDGSPDLTSGTPYTPPLDPTTNKIQPNSPVVRAANDRI